MNREILFRGLSAGAEKKWQYGYFDGGGILIMNNYKCIFCSTIHDTICQYTGLKDMDGNKIFEGDIVEYYHHKKHLLPVDDIQPDEYRHGVDKQSGLPLVYRTTRVIRYKGVVSIDSLLGVELNLHNNCHWWFCENNGILEQVKVIGNIFDNPNLAERLNNV